MYVARFKSTLRTSLTAAEAAKVIIVEIKPYYKIDYLLAYLGK